MLRARGAMLVVALMLAAGIGARAQDRGYFYDGVRDGARGGHYDRGHDRERYDDRDRRDYDDHDRDHGVGPGTGAVIGGGGGAVLGALFGGLKGSIIGGAAGAGIGAVIGKEHQEDNGYRR